MSRRFYSLVALAIASLLGTALFLTSEKVQRAEKDLAAIAAKVASEQDSLRILRAEWAYLNRPDRLEQLASAHLHLAAAQTPQMITSVESLPTPVIPVIPGVKPAVFAASPATIPAPPIATKQPAQKATTPRFDQLITRLSDPVSDPKGGRRD